MISAEGRAIIDAGGPGEQAPGHASATAAPTVADAASSASSSPRKGSKVETVIGLLRRDEGASLAQMVEATGWLPHTTRAALTGLRKKGHAITKSKRYDVTVYQIAQARA